MGRGFVYEFSLIWVFGVSWSGFFNKIDSADRAPALPVALTAGRLVPRARALWQHQLDACEESGGVKRPRLSKLVWDLSGVYIAFGMLMSLVQGLTTTAWRPLVIRDLVRKLNEGGHDSSALAMDVGMIALTLVVEGWSSVALKHALSDYLGTIWFTAVGSLVSRKSLSIPAGTTTMQESSLMGNDVLRGYENLRFASILFMALAALVGGVVVLIITIGSASLIGLGLMLAILFVNGRIAKRAQTAEEEDLEAADERLSLMSEIIQGIKAIKLSAWEDSYNELIRQARVKEMKCLGLYRTLHQSSVQLGRACPVLCAGVSFIYLAATEDQLDAADLFAALNVFLALRLPLIIIPESVTYVGGFVVSFRRLEAYLTLGEVDDAFSSYGGTHDGRPAAAVEDVEKDVGKVQESQSFRFQGGGGHAHAEGESEGADDIGATVHVEIDGQPGQDQSDATVGGDSDYLLKGTYMWHMSAGSGSQVDSHKGNSQQQEGDAVQSGASDAFVLRNLDLAVPKGSRCAVIGGVGSGKSSLLCAMANELQCVAGVAGSAAGSNSFKLASKGYIAQHSFVMSGSIRDNLTLCKPGLELSGDEQFAEALRRAALVKDLRYFPKGLDTAVGERGVTLSGGQQARLGIARALFHRPELVLADDPLAAVDGPVAQHLVQNVIVDKPAGQTLVVALNQLKFLDRFDYCIEMDAGRVTAAGPVTPALVQRVLLGEQESLRFERQKASASGPSASPAAGPAPAGAGALASPTSARSDVAGSVVSDSVSEAGSRMSSRGEDEAIRQQQAVDADNELVKKEHRNRGGISSHVLKSYAKGMGFRNIALGVTTGILTYSIMAANDLWLASFVATANPTQHESMVFSVVYACGCVGYLVCLLTTSVIFSRAGVRSSQHLHDHCMDRLLHAPLSWFETTPSGRILARFSSDLGMVDQTLSRFVDNQFQLMATVLALIVVVCVLVPPVTIIIVLSGVLFGAQVLAVDRSNREIKREANMAMSSVQTVVTESVNGRMTLRAFGAADVFWQRFQRSADAWNKQSFLSLSMVNMSCLASYALSFLISTGTGFFIVFGDLDPAKSGLALTYSLMIPYFSLHCAFVFTIVQTALSSLERIIDFTGPNVPQEADWRLITDPWTRLQVEKHRALGAMPLADKDTAASATAQHQLDQVAESELWPSAGAIEFQAATLRYRPTLPPAVNNVSFHVGPGQRVGIVGRSGAGKSSLLGLLFRITELNSGTILIDGVDISQLGLVTLREAYSGIPQQPLLLKGTVRKNLAPFGGRSDALLAQALLDSGLASNSPEAHELLDMDVHGRLSAGERQLLSFARTLLRPGAIRVLDESSSCMDDVADARMQRALRVNPGTTIVVAHRIATVADSDLIGVMDAGEMVEFGPPQELLRRKGHYYKLVKSHEKK